MLILLRSTFGEILVFVVVIAFLAAFPIIIIGVVFYVLRRNNKNRAVWQKFARDVDLHMPNPKQLRMQGRYSDCEVMLSLGSRSSGDSESRHREFFTYSYVNFPTSLRLLLNVSSPKGYLSGLFSSNQMAIGEEGFDKTFNAKCYDPQMLKMLLLRDFPSDRTQNLMGDFMLANPGNGIVYVTDKQVYIENSGQIGNEAVLKQMLDTTTSLAKRVYECRQKLPKAQWETALVENWKYVASQNGLLFDPTKMSIEGTYKGFPLTISLSTSADKWLTEFGLKFPRSLMVGLRIIPENSIHKAFTWLGAQDIEAGIKAFDDAFIVKAKNIAVAKQMLQPDFCNRLVALSKKSSDFSIDDESMSVTYSVILGDAKTLKSYIEGIVSNARLLHR